MLLTWENQLKGEKGRGQLRGVHVEREGKETGEWGGKESEEREEGNMDREGGRIGEKEKETKGNEKRVKG